MIINKIYNYMVISIIFLLFFIISSFTKAEPLGDLSEAVKDAMSETISQVKEIDLGEANSDLAKNIDGAIQNMAQGMDFALKVLNEGDSQTALQTIEILEATMDMAISEIPKEEFMDFSNINFDDYEANELIAVQSMMGDMMQKNIGAMTKMMDQIQSVEGAGLDIDVLMGSLDEKGFGFENIFGKNMEDIGSMFGKDMSMIDMIDGMEMSVELKSFISDHENMDLYSMMDNMKEMKGMSSMKMENMSYENFSSITAVIPPP